VILNRKNDRVTAMERRGVVVVDPPLSGIINMEKDDALLANATPDSPIVVRLYRWSEPTLSLGHFQEIEGRSEVAGLENASWVRRRTGGGAILHDFELTYSVVIPDVGDKVLKGHSESLYRSVHLTLADELRRLGWDANLSEECTCSTSPNRNSEPFLCFSRRSPVDLLVGPYKIMGSAQRRTSKGLLQHGSLLLRHSPLTPGLAGLLDIERTRGADMRGESTRVVFAGRRVAGPVEMTSTDVPAGQSVIDRGEELLATESVHSGQHESDLHSLSFWVELLTSVLKRSVETEVRCRWES
jgi:lipoate-protein ligase A